MYGNPSFEFHPPITPPFIMSFSIQKKQNEPQMLRLLCEQRRLYSDAKNKFIFIWILSVPLSIICAPLSLIYPDFKPYSILISFFITTLDISWFSPVQKKERETAAKIQEKFDTEVFALPWNSSRVGSEPTPDVLYSGNDHTVEIDRVKNWYDGDLDRLPLALSRIICQWQNIQWDSQQRRRLIEILLYLLWAIIATTILAAALLHSTFIDTLATLLPPATPLFYFCLKHRQEHIEAADRLDKLKDTAQKLWKDALDLISTQQDAAQTERVLTERARQLQDEIYDSRRRSVPVLDWYYNRLKSTMQRNTKEVANRQVQEALGRLQRVSSVESSSARP